MSSPAHTPQPPLPSTPVRAGQVGSAVASGSATNQTRCSSDPADFTLVKIHTAKCSICDKRNATDEMRRCKGCTWQICRPCQIKREQQNRSLAHGNLVTATSTGSRVRRQKLFPLTTFAKKDLEAEAEFAKIKAEEQGDHNSKKEVASQHDDVITPPSSGERKNPGRKTKIYTSYAELEDDLEEDAEVLSASPVGSKLGKRKLPEPSLVVHELFTKRACTEQPARMHPPVCLFDKSKPSEHDKCAAPFNKTETRLDQDRDLTSAKHDKIMKSMFSGFGEGKSVLGPNLYSSTPAPESTPAKLPGPPSLLGRQGVPRMSGEEFMENVVRPKVRKNLNERFAWQLEEAKETPAPPAKQPTPPAQKNETLRDLVNSEAASLHHNLTLDKDQQAELLSTMNVAARKFGNEKYGKMAPAFKTLAKPGLDFELAHLNDTEKLTVVAAIQRQAAKKLQEFEEEIGTL